MRSLFFAVLRAGGRIVVRGGENVFRRGPMLFVGSSGTAEDALTVAAAAGRPVRCACWPSSIVVRFLLRAAGCSPLSPAGSPASAGDARWALRRGEAVLAPERDPLLESLPSRGCPVIPVHVDADRPRGILGPAEVSFGPPLLRGASRRAAREATVELSVEAFGRRVERMLPLHRTLLRRARARWTREAVSDSSGRRLSYGKLLAAAAVLARRVQAIHPGAGPVGVLLPPSVPGALVNVALAMAGRPVVNLNYTLPRETMDHIRASAGVARVLTSRRMLEALGWEPDPGMIFLEDLGVSPPVVVLAYYVLLRLAPARFGERLLPGGGAIAGDTAAFLFTSGSTGVPKGVMLTHANIQANVQSCLELFRLGRKDALGGALPFFHSFGYTTTLWLPLLGGARVAYHRSLLDIEAVERLVRDEQVTLLVTTPTVLSMWARSWRRASVSSLRFFVTGAEKLREAVVREVADRLGVQVLEGYGCTELSPVACLNGPDDAGENRRPGKVGRPVPGVSGRVVDPAEFRPLPAGSAGLLLVKGPNVMKGYWGMPEETAEVIKDGWYITGDVASVDGDGFVEITDRLSRFSKIAGEMVPHLFVEEKLAAVAGRKEAKFFVASVPDPRKGEALVVLCNGYEGSPRELVDGLRSTGLPRLWLPHPDHVFQVSEWPILGTGKTDLGKARRLARDLWAAKMRSP